MTTTRAAGTPSMTATSRAKRARRRPADLRDRGRVMETGGRAGRPRSLPGPQPALSRRGRRTPTTRRPSGPARGLLRRPRARPRLQDRPVLSVNEPAHGPRLDPDRPNGVRGRSVVRRRGVRWQTWEVGTSTTWACPSCNRSPGRGNARQAGSGVNFRVVAPFAVTDSSSRPSTATAVARVSSGD